MEEHDLDAIVVTILENTDGENPWVVARTIVAAILRELDHRFEGEG